MWSSSPRRCRPALWLGVTLCMWVEPLTLLQRTGAMTPGRPHPGLCGWRRTSPAEMRRREPWQPCMSRRAAVRVRRRCRSDDGILAMAYRELGLLPKADLSQVRSAFRQLARQFHPDLCAPSHLAEAGARFIAIKQAYDVVVAALGQGELGGSRPGRELSRSMEAFSRNMVTGRGHHKQSDGRTYELWLDLRGDPHNLGMAKQKVLQLFWRTRAVVDALGVSLLKEGAVAGILVDDPDRGADPSLSRDDPAWRTLVIASHVDTVEAIKSWDYGWQPLLLVDQLTGRVRHGASQTPMGQLRSVAEGQLLALRDTAEDKDPRSSPVAMTEELIVNAVDAWETEQAQVRYRFAMRAMLLPLDPAAWAVAAAYGAEAGAAVDAAGALQSTM